MRPLLLEYHRHSIAENNGERENSLLKIAYLPSKVLIKKRGGKRRRATRQLNAQLRRAQEEDYDIGIQPNTNTQQHTPKDPQTQRVLRAVEKVREGYVSRAGSVLQQHQLASPTPENIEVLRSMHPQGPHPEELPKAPPTPPILAIDKKQLIDIIKGLATGAAPGLSGWTAELMVPLLDDEDCVIALAQLIGDIINGVCCNPAESELLRAGKLFVLDYITKLRPINCQEQFTKTAATYLMHEDPQYFRECLQPIQFGTGAKGGPATIIHLVQALLEQGGNDTVVAGVDLKWAFQLIPRQDILQAVFQDPKLASWCRFVEWMYGTPSKNIWVSDGQVHVTIPSTQGAKQGCSLSAFLFSKALQSVAVRSIQGLTNTRLMMQIDDSTFCGPAEEVFQAIGEYRSLTSAKGMIAHTGENKNLLLWPHADPPPQSVVDGAAEHQMCIVRDTSGAHSRSMPMLGSTVGLDYDEMQRWAQGEAKAHGPILKALLHPKMPNQIAYILLSQSMLPRFDYIIRTLPPTITLPAAREFDELLLDTHAQKQGLNLSKLSTVASEQIKLPYRNAGLGLVPRARVAPAAYLSSMATAAPFTASLLTRRPTPMSVKCVRHCYRLLNDTGAKGIVPKILPPVDQFVDHFQRHSAWGVQKLVVRAVSNHIYSELRRHPRTTVAERARLTAGAAPKASTWLVTLPTEPRLLMNNIEWAVSESLLIGAPLLPRVPTTFCDSCKQMVDPMCDHLVTCRRATVQWNDRHNTNNVIVADFARRAGAFVTIEPTRLYHTGDRKSRPDLKMIFPVQTTLSDMTVLHPLAESYRRAAAVKPLATAEARGAVKHGLYDPLVEDKPDWRFVALAHETLGGVGSEAQDFYAELAEMAAAMPGCTDTPIELRRQLYQRLAISVKKGTAQAVLSAAKALRVANA